MPPTKKSVRYRPGSTSEMNACYRCLHCSASLVCGVLQNTVRSEHTCDRFEENPSWKSRYRR